MTRGSVALAITLLVLLSCAPAGAAPTYRPHFDVQRGFRSFAVRGIKNPNTPASVAVLGRDHFVVADYQRLYTVKRVHGVYRAHVLRRPPGLEVWAPTAVDYRRAAHELVLANYTGHDVLRLRMYGDRLHVIKRITNRAMVSPENLAVRADGAIAVTDFDGDGVLRFTPGGKLLWRQVIPNAHGVAWRGDQVIATSLKDGGIRVYGPDGELVQTNGGFGPGVGLGLWSTGVAIRKNRVAVADAHQGRITLYDGKLQVLRAFGSNGPGTDLFDMPYGIAPYGDGYVVTDAYKRRLVFLDGRLRMLRELTLAGRDRRGRNLEFVENDGSLPRSYPTFPVTSLLDFTQPRAAYDAVIDSATGARFAMTTSGTCARQAGLFPMTFMTWSAERDGVALLGTPQQSVVVGIDLATSAFATTRIPHDAWFVGGRLVDESWRRVDLDAIARGFAERFARERAARQAGISPYEALERVFPKRATGFGACLLNDLLMSGAAAPYKARVAGGEPLSDADYEAYEKAANEAGGERYLFEELAMRFLVGRPARDG